MTVRVLLKMTMLGAPGDTGRAVDEAVLPLLQTGMEIEHISPERVRDLTVARITFTAPVNDIAWMVVREAAHKAEQSPGVEVTSVSSTISPIREDEAF